jgi:GNAT superfamily N-acetyltransferase
MESTYYCYEADLFAEWDGIGLLEMLDHYAQDTMGGGEPISDHVREHLIPELQARSKTTHVFLVRKRKDGSQLSRKDTDEVCGLAVSFDGFSTFYCRKLLNIHDFAVKQSHRRKGLGSMMLMEITQFCRANNYCKITLEVLDGNHPARKLYSEMGFAAYELDPVMGKAMCWQKVLE